MQQDNYRSTLDGRVLFKASIRKLPILIVIKLRVALLLSLFPY
jgi:hypothetical protein